MSPRFWWLRPLILAALASVVVTPLVLVGVALLVDSQMRANQPYKIVGWPDRPPPQPLAVSKGPATVYLNLPAHLRADEVIDQIFPDLSRCDAPPCAYVERGI